MENAAMEQQDIKKWCGEHMHRYVLAQTKEGWCCDGFIEYMDDEIVCLAVPCGMGDWEDRAFVPFGGGRPPFGFPLYPYPYFPRRRFTRQVFPLAGLLALSLLPFF